MKKLISLLIILIFSISFYPVKSQTREDSLSLALKYKHDYDFRKALDILENILENEQDSINRIKIYKNIAECENGLSMLRFGTTPTAISKIEVERELFYLHYPFIPDSSFVNIPRKLTKGGDPLLSPVYLRGSETQIYFSALSAEGDWNIYVTKYIDQENWSAPEKLSSIINSPNDELFPYLSQDGKRLYFSSNGHFGVGGFDLYFSEIDPLTNEWTTPQNMGFPYSSPHDDLLLIHTPDLKYTIFSSTRKNLSIDSISIYILNYQATPVKKEIDASLAKEISELKIPVPLSQIKPDSNNIEPDRFLEPEVDEYRQLLIKSRSIQNRIDSLNSDLTKSRQLYTTLSKQEDILFLEKKISEDELKVIKFRESISTINQKLQALEMNFLTKGRLLPRDDEFFENKEKNIEEPEEVNTIEFSMNSLGSFPNINILDPIELFDYTFDIKDTSEFAQNMDIPDGIVYRVQLFSVGNRSTNISTFKGIRPIFEKRGATGRWTYYAGQFYLYQDAQQALSRVKRGGFPNAIIAAFNNGNSINLRTARNLEQKIEENISFQIKLSGYPAGIPETVLEIIRSNTDKDIAKRSDNGRDIYFIGPYSNRTEAEDLMDLIKNLGGEKISIEEISSK